MNDEEILKEISKLPKPSSTHDVTTNACKMLGIIVRQLGLSEDLYKIIKEKISTK